jgi:hypothetical protein
MMAFCLIVAFQMPFLILPQLPLVGIPPARLSVLPYPMTF